MLPKVKLRADASDVIGLGHIIRLLALAKCLRNVTCSFILKNPDQNVVDLILSENFSVDILSEFDLDTIQCVPYLAEPILETDIIVLDGYNFDFNFQLKVKQIHKCKLVQIDDTISNPFAADLIINHIGGIEESEFRITSGTKLLHGPKYAIVRQEFLNKNSNKNVVHTPKKVFVNFGGADPENFTCKIVAELLQFQNLFQSFEIVIGPLFKFLPQLELLAQESKKIRISCNLDAQGIVSLMRDCDLAICSASTVAYEYCCTTGMLFIIQTAQNQSRLYKFLIRENLAVPYMQFQGYAELPNFIKRDSMVATQQRLFDGKSPVRLSQEFMQLFLKDNLLVRRAATSDIEVYFRWANDPLVRNNSFNSHPISYPEHCRWFYSKLNHPEACLYIFTTKDGTPVANVRFQISSEEAVLSFLLDERFRGFNLSKDIVATGTRQFFREYGHITKIVAHVKSDNLASYKAFESNNYNEVTSESLTFKTFYKLRTNG